MLVKEAEAKEKICPETLTGPADLRFCLGSLCMAWSVFDCRDGTLLGYCGKAGYPELRNIDDTLESIFNAVEHYVYD
jgi:hypothetical protein